MLSFAEAQSRILASATRIGTERVPLAQAWGRVLAETVRAPVNLPPFDASAMDGYAVATRSFVGTGAVTLPVIGESRAGAVPDALAAGAACRIFTGAMMPDGADAVIMQEHVVREGDRARFESAPRPGANVRRAGEDLAAGSIALAEGTRLTAARIALAATADRAELVVGRRPRVAILSTGDELRAPGSAPRNGSIPESNGPGLRALAEQAGATVSVLPVVGDDPNATERAIAEALAGVDVLFTVGGVSVGDHDVVRPALERAGVELAFWKVAMKPGKPLAVGRRGATHVLGLPGNPVSALVTCLLFGVPLLRALAGDRAPLPRPLRARLTHDIQRSAGRTEFARVTLEQDGDGLAATPLANQASGAMIALATCDALAVIPAEMGTAPAGTWVSVLRLADV